MAVSCMSPGPVYALNISAVAHTYGTFTAKCAPQSCRHRHTCIGVRQIIMQPATRHIIKRQASSAPRPRKEHNSCHDWKRSAAIHVLCCTCNAPPWQKFASAAPWRTAPAAAGEVGWLPWHPPSRVTFCPAELGMPMSALFAAAQ